MFQLRTDAREDLLHHAAEAVLAVGAAAALGPDVELISQRDMIHAEAQVVEHVAVRERVVVGEHDVVVLAVGVADVEPHFLAGVVVVVRPGRLGDAVGVGGLVLNAVIRVQLVELLFALGQPVFHALFDDAAVTGEMDKAKRLALHVPSVGAFLQTAVHHAPRGKVVAVVLEDVGVEKAGSEVDPLLVGEHAVLDVVVAEQVQPLGPPVDHLLRFLAAVDAQKTQIIHAVRRAGQLHVDITWLKDMGAHNDRVFLQQLTQLDEVGVDIAVGVQIYKLRLVRIRRVQITEELPFHRGGCFDDSVLEDVAVKVTIPHILRQHNLVEIRRFHRRDPFPLSHANYKCSVRDMLLH